MNKSTRGNAPKIPKDNPPTSTIRHYMAPDGSSKSPALGKKVEKTGGTKKGAGGGFPPIVDTSTEGEQEVSQIEDPRTDTHIPTKVELEGMLKRLENVIREEVSALRTDITYMLERVEKAEAKIEQQDSELNELKNQFHTLKQNQRQLQYRLEDQENRNRRKNLRIRSIKEEKGEDLRKILNNLFLPLLENGAEEPLKIERVHRVGRIRGGGGNWPRDIIVRFRYFEDKAVVWSKLRRKPPLSYDGAEIQIFTDLAWETLARRRHLKPLLEQMRQLNINYQWGFPACLIGYKDGVSAKIIFPEDLPAFCRKFDMPVMELPGWVE